MTREEEIKQIAFEYAEKIDYDLWLNPTPMVGKIKMLVAATAEDNARWADEHPVTPWCDAKKEVPEYSHFETTYICGSKPHWNVGDILAFYESYSDREGEVLLGEVIDVKFDEEFGDWDYTFKDGYQTFEETLLSEKTYKKEL